VSDRRFEFAAAVWEWEGKGAWHFLSLPDDVADEIEERFGQNAKGFGSIPVAVRIGTTTWSTSLFPDSKRRTYVLPLKQAVRKAERLAVGTVAEVELTVRA
jgi:hypothetical protein